MASRGQGLNSDQRSDARREAVLDAALELFAERGYLSTPIELLCQRARVSTKSFYLAFDSREACYIALMQRSVTMLKNIVESRAGASSAPDEMAMADAVLACFAHALADDPRQAIVLFGRGSATTARVEELRRTNRRWAADFVVGFWRRFDRHLDPQPGVVTGLVGGLFDIVADWVFGDSAREPSYDGRELLTAMRNFYVAVRSSI